MVIVDVRQQEVGIPTNAYFAVEEIKDVSPSIPLFFYAFSIQWHYFCDLKDGTETQKTFFHVPSAIEAEEAEEIGVEHLLRDIKDSTTTTLTTRVAEQLSSLRGLQSRLSEVRDYLKNVANGSLPISHQVVYHLQDAFNLLPNLDDAALTRAFTTNTNDQLLVVYLSALIRAVIALEKLVENKATNGVAELEEGIAKGSARGKALTNGAAAPSVTEKKDDAGETGDRKSAEK
jgi:26S proteasome regulatory subunit N8